MRYFRFYEEYGDEPSPGNRSIYAAGKCAIEFQDRTFSCVRDWTSTFGFSDSSLVFNRKCKSFPCIGVSIFTFEGGWITLYQFFAEGFDTPLDFWVLEFDEPET